MIAFSSSKSSCEDFPDVSASPDTSPDTLEEASFAVLLEKTEQERRQRTDRLDTLLAEVREYEQSAADIQSWAAVVRKHLHIRELDRETVDELIDRIEVGEKTVVDGKNVRDIKIYYRFVGNI